MSKTKLKKLAGGTPDFDNWMKAREILNRMSAEQQRDAVAVWEKASAHWGTELSPWVGMSLGEGVELRRSRREWTKEIFSGDHQPKHNTIRILEPVGALRRGMKVDNLIADEAQLANLKQVGLDQTRVASSFFKRLKGEGPWQKWEVLRLWTCDLKGATLKALAKANLSGMTGLNIEQSRIGPDGVKALQKAPNFTALIGVNLSLNRLGAEGLAHVVASSWVGQLTYLGLDHNTLSDTDLATLRSEVLQSLLLEGNPVGADLSWVLGMPGLRRLKMRRCPVQDQALTPVLAASDCPALDDLHLEESKVTDATAFAIADSGLRLKTLQLGKTGITAEGWTRLLASPALQDVTYISVQQTDFGESHARQILDGACPRLTRIWGMSEPVEALLKADPRWA